MMFDSNIFNSDIMLLAYIVVAVCVFFQAERGIFDMISYFRLVKHLYIAGKNSKGKVRGAFFILIPVFNEQRVIQETLMRLSSLIESSPSVQLVIVTSVREELTKKDAFLNITTKDVVMRALKKGSLKKIKNNIIVLTDPSNKGNMATQLNYGLSVLRKKYDLNNLFMVYNADSIVAPDTLSTLVSLILKTKRENIVVQQPCAFIKDMSVSSSYFINALSIYQTYYCLGHEHRILLKYERRRENTLFPRLGVITGHGSGMRMSTHVAYNGYPADLLTEDLTFGFILSANKVPIHVLPSLEVADVPRQFRSFVHQRSTWFWNYIGYLACFYRLLKDGQPFMVLLLLLMQGVGRGAYWLMLSLFVLIPFIVGIIFASPIIIVLATCCIIVFHLLPHYLVFRTLPAILEQQKLYEFASSVKKTSFVKTIIPLLFIIFTDSVGPWIGLAQGIKYLMVGNFPRKNKMNH